MENEQEHIMELLTDMWVKNLMMKFNIDEHANNDSLDIKWLFTHAYLSGMKMGFNIHDSLKTKNTSLKTQ